MRRSRTPPCRQWRQAGAALGVCGVLWLCCGAAAVSADEWYEKVKVSGYVQARWEAYPDAEEELGEPENDFLVRRGRIKLEAKPTERLKTTLQVDLPVGDGEVEIKDVFGDLYLSDSHEWWIRFGQSKVPFGFEIPQSSSQRLPLERSDARKGLIPGERDMGVWFHYTPEELHERFDELKNDSLGTGDFGLIAVGFYRGQGINTEDANDNKHFVLRLDYPFKCGGDEEDARRGQAGFSIFSGEYVTGGVDSIVAAEVDEHAWNVHFYLPPDPWGVQFEYMDGESAALTTPDTVPVVTKADVDGWYGQFHAKVGREKKGTIFVRYDEMNGYAKDNKGLGQKPKPNNVERWTFGYAHAIDSNTELTVQYDDKKKNGSDDDFFGVQMQFSY